MELLHQAITFGSWAVLVVFVAWILGWITEEVQEALDARRKRQRADAIRVVRQEALTWRLNYITANAIAQMLKIAREADFDA